MESDLAPHNLLAAYAIGIFPMADHRGRLRWITADPRAVIDLESFRVSRSLRAVVRRGVFEVTVNQAFQSVLQACADREEGTWISEEIERAYCALHEMGFAHSVESWYEEQLAGGLYGVALGGAFFGESMFYRVPDASKVALVHLVDRLRERGFTLLDVQFVTEHLRRFGAVEIPADEYHGRLQEAISLPCRFVDVPGSSGTAGFPGSGGKAHD